MEWLLTFLISYLLGSFSSAYFLGRLFLRKDMRREGSGNLGAKNTFEIGGPLIGIAVFVIDCLKGVMALLLTRALFGAPYLVYLAAAAVILGHNFSLYIGFRGGKGLATVVGVLSVLNLYVLLAMGVLAGVFALLSRHSGVAAILATIPFPLIFGLITGDWTSLPFTAAVTVIVLVKHRPEEYVEAAAFLGWKR